MNMHDLKAFKPTAKAKPNTGLVGGSKYRRDRHLRKLLNLPPRGKPLLDAINKGFSVKMLRDVAGTLAVDVYRVGQYLDIKTATLNRRLKGGVLTTDESDRLYRFTEVYDAALDLFDGDNDLADQWLNSPALGLGGEVPISIIKTSTGANDVLSLISKIEHGVLV